MHWGVENLTALTFHQGIVGLADALRPRGVPLQRFTRQEVVVADVDVVVEMTTPAVGVGHHEVVRAVHILGELAAKIIDPLDVVGVVHIELVR